MTSLLGASRAIAGGDASASDLPVRVAVVGTGVAGLAAASELVEASKRFGVVDYHNDCTDVAAPFEVVCYEKSDSIGGHAMTFDVPMADGDAVPVDGGFMVLNPSRYPHLLDWFDRYGIEVEPSDMCFSVNLFDVEDGADVPATERKATSSFAWSSDGLSTIFSSWGSMLQPGMYRFVYSLVCFKGDVEKWLQSPDVLAALAGDESPASYALVDLSLGAWLDERGYGEPFRSGYLAPMAAAIWSCATAAVWDFPALFFLQFLFNHQLLDLTGRPQWLTVKGRTRDGYVTKVAEQFRDSIRVKTSIVSITRDEHARRRNLTVEDSSGNRDQFDYVVVAAHAPDARELVCEAATPEQLDILEKFNYQESNVAIHHDLRLLPENKKLWASWNFFQRPAGASRSTGDVDNGRFVSYYLDRLQNLNTGQSDTSPVVCTLWPSGFDEGNTVLPAREKTVHEWTAAHPVPNRESFDLIRTGRFGKMQGGNGLFFCGAYTGFGFHEDGILSGLQAARQLILDVAKLKGHYPDVSIATAALRRHLTPRVELLGHLSGRQRDRSSGVSDQSPVPKSISSVQSLARTAVHGFLRKFLRTGAITLVEAFGGGDTLTIGNRDSGRKLIVLRVQDPVFYSKVAHDHDVGLGQSYIEGDWKCNDLQELFHLFIANRDSAPDPSVLSSFTSVLGRWMNDRTHKYRANANSTATRQNISAHYDQSNEMFALFLDQSMTYSCAVFEDGPSTANLDISSDYLCRAQINKIRKLVAAAEVEKGDNVLEIGFGWGAMSVYLAQELDCHVWGLTQSSEQLEWAQRVADARGVADKLHFILVDYRDFKMPENIAALGGFDRIVSCEMLEAVGHDYLPDFYRVTGSLLRRGGKMSVQVITTPDERYESYRQSSDFIQHFIFPGGLCPSIGALAEACGKGAGSKLVLETSNNYGEHYAKTLQIWQRRLLHRRAMLFELDEKFDDSYLRTMDYYFAYCAAGFATRTLGLYQLAYSSPLEV